MRRVQPVAKVYARALFEMSKERSLLEEVQTHLDEVLKLLDANPALLTALNSLTFSASARVKALGAVATKVGVHPLLKRLLEILITKNRLNCLPDIYLSFVDLLDENKKLLRGSVTTVEALDPKEREQLEKAFSKKFDKQVVLVPSMDKSILGGLVVKVQGLTFDGSLRTSMQKLRENLERRAI